MQAAYRCFNGYHSTYCYHRAAGAASAFDLNVDPMVALPAGGIVGAIVMKKENSLIHTLFQG